MEQFLPEQAQISNLNLNTNKRTIPTASSMVVMVLLVSTRIGLWNRQDLSLNKEEIVCSTCAVSRIKMRSNLAVKIITNPTATSTCKSPTPPPNSSHLRSNRRLSMLCPRQLKSTICWTIGEQSLRKWWTLLCVRPQIPNKIWIAPKFSKGICHLSRDKRSQYLSIRVMRWQGLLSVCIKPLSRIRGPKHVLSVKIEADKRTGSWCRIYTGKTHSRWQWVSVLYVPPPQIS